MAVGTSLLTYHLGRRLYGGSVGLWSGLAMATCLMFAVSGRAATPDSALIFCITLTLYLFVRFGGVENATLQTPLRRGGYLAMYAAMGFALALASDVRIATPTLKMNAAFIRIGLSAIARREDVNRGLGILRRLLENAGASYDTYG